ncbi:MAG: glycoside hydrolase family 32 protein, partial [Clostridia bacterium]|nr:glycoside hydrolase family 32 protein [Clostridia bacterium]
MKNWYKILSLALIVVMSFSFVACSFTNGTADGTVSVGSGNNGFTLPEADTTGKNNGADKEIGNSDVIFSDATSYDAVMDNVSMESSTDSFTLSEITYGAEESFVYTATVAFENGVAAGLAFGAEDGAHYWVFNVDRQANRVKLLYFSAQDGKTTATELLTDYFIGNDKMTDSERRLVGDKVKNIDKVQLKVVITPEEDGVYAEFYADNIRRFGIENTIELNSLEQLPEEVSYEGGKIGFNCFNSKVKFDDIYYGKSDYSYYTELYRNQYHFSQYAHWNNDPNGLIYFDGYYHLYYQHHPYNNYWGDMYWGHARSKDLAHWELLPICLFPDEDWGEGVGYMWSGSAYEYRLGDSADIDALNWFPSGEGNGIIAFYTRDGGRQDQMIMSSDDGGMTWTKRKMIPQDVATGADGIFHKVACRDPKVFPVAFDENGKTTVWGMVVTGQQENKVWFMKSTNLLDWSYAGQFVAQVPECPDVLTLTADDGEVFNVLTLTSREYIVGKFNYDGNSIVFTDKDGGAIDQSDIQKMDFGPDSYAAQTFSIRDESSDYFGKTVGIHWFAGVPVDTDSGIYANARKVWNGSGMTIPVIYGLAAEGDGYLLTQTPIVKDSTVFDKEN